VIITITNAVKYFYLRAACQCDFEIVADAALLNSIIP